MGGPGDRDCRHQQRQCDPAVRHCRTEKAHQSAGSSVAIEKLAGTAAGGKAAIAAPSAAPTASAALRLDCVRGCEPFKHLSLPLFRIAAVGLFDHRIESVVAKRRGEACRYVVTGLCVLVGKIVLG